MRFSQHLGKGAWAFASRGLPFLYAAVLVLAAKVLPIEQFGLLALFQAIFTLIFTLADNFALQAIVKYAVEPDVILEELVSTIGVFFLGIVALASLILFILSGPLSTLLKAPELAVLIPWLVLFAFLSLPRVLFSKILQSRFRMRELFFVDAANFGLSTAIILWLFFQRSLSSASDIIHITIVSGALSSLVAIWFVRKELLFRFQYSPTLFARVRGFVGQQGGLGLFSLLQQNLDTFIVSSFTGASGVGIYNGAKLLFRGFDVVRDTGVLFLFPATSKYYSRNELDTVRTMLKKAISFLTLTLIPAAIVLYILAPTIFHLLWGTKYEASIPVFRILLAAAFAFPLVMVLTPSNIGMGRVSTVFRSVFFALLVNVPLSILLLSTIGIRGAAVAFVVSTTVQAIVLYQATNAHLGLGNVGFMLKGAGDAVNFLRSLRR